MHVVQHMHALQYCHKVLSRELLSMCLVAGAETVSGAGVFLDIDLQGMLNMSA